MPKKSQMPSHMPEIQPDTLSHNHEASPVIPSHKPLTILPPISTIFPISEPKALTIPAIICGTALTIFKQGHEQLHARHDDLVEISKHTVYNTGDNFRDRFDNRDDNLR